MRIAEDGSLTVNYQLDVADPAVARTRRFIKEDTWPWPFPPRQGDYIAPDSELPIAAPIARVIFRPGAGVIQIILADNRLEGDVAGRIEDLHRAGFHEA